MIGVYGSWGRARAKQGDLSPFDRELLVSLDRMDIARIPFQAGRLQPGEVIRRELPLDGDVCHRPRLRCKPLSTFNVQVSGRDSLFWELMGVIA